MPLAAPNILREGFEILTAMVMKSTIFFDITPCRSRSTNVPEENIASLFGVE
jgi:hypothetical protein